MCLQYNSYDKKVLLVIAAGRCVWDDLANIIPRLKHEKLPFETMGINYMIFLYDGKLDYAASWHFDWSGMAVKLRTYRGQLNKPILYGPKPYEGVDKVERFHGTSIESSGMYGSYIGLRMGFDKIILVGIPFDDSGHFWQRPQTERTRSRFSYSWPAKKSWDKLRDDCDDKIRAVSGSLIECFGELTDEWLRK